MKYPIVIQAYDKIRQQDYKKPASQWTVYSERESKSIEPDLVGQWVRERKPKLKELTRFNFWQKKFCLRIG